MQSLERPSEAGLSLIELVIFIIVAGVFIPFTFVGFSAILKESITPESVVKARFIAERKVEEETSRPFDQIAIVDPPSPYEDVPGCPGYQWKKWIKYVEYQEGNGEITFLESSTPTPYKRIVVQVKEPKGFVYTVTTLATKRPLDG